MEPVQARQIDNIFDDGLAPGVFTFEVGSTPYSTIIYICPCGCDQLVSLPVATGPKQDRFWFWDGNKESPTLQPSIRRLDGCKFHGYLTGGMWTFCSDSGS